MNINWSKTLELSSRWYVFIFLNFYGFGKILGGQFYRKGAWPEAIANTTIKDASAYDLAWSFMGYSQAYIMFIGLSQIIGAWLLLKEKTKLLGVMILFPIMVNIIVFDTIFLDVKDALVNAIIYFLMLLYILYFNRAKIAIALGALTTPDNVNPFAHDKALFKTSIILFMMLVIFGIDQGLVNLVRWYYINR